MTKTTFLPTLILLLFFRPTFSGETDTIYSDTTIIDGDILVSSSGKFALGFVSPGSSKNRYVGIWFNNITETTIVWVANRQSPLTDTSGTFTLNPSGILILRNSTNATVWASTAARSATTAAATAELLDSGNLVVRDGGESPENILWQSFEHPTDTYLPGMNLGWDLLAGKETYLTSWKSKDDPAEGEFTFHLDPTGYPQMVIKRGTAVQNRIGPWNGIRFPGPPNPREDPTYKLSFVMDKEKVYYRSDPVHTSFVSRYTMNSTGVSQRWTWVDRTRGWVVYFSMPSDLCDTYALCGAYGTCDVSGSPSCRCLDPGRFAPGDEEGWALRADWSSGCVRRKNLSCGIGGDDAFVRYDGIKLPDARNTWHDEAMTLGACREVCLRNCSCMAYTQLDVKTERGCLIWYGDLVDMRTLTQDGQVLYVRMASSDAGKL